MARSAAYVAIEREAYIAGVVEELLTAEHIARKRFVGDRVVDSGLRNVSATRGQSRDVIDAHRAVHEVVHVQRFTVWRDDNTLRCTSHFKTHAFAAIGEVDRRDLATALERDV